VLIIGGGIGGLTLARALLLARVPFLLFERAPSLRHADVAAGTGMGLWGPAERVLDALGLGDEVRAMSRRMGCAGYRTTDGAWLAQPPAQTPQRGDMRTCLTVRRGELQGLLLKSVPAHLVHLDHAFVGARQESIGGGSVIAEFANGVRVRGSMLVAADGIHSAVRRLVDPDIVPQYCGYAYWRADVELPEVAGLKPERPSDNPAALAETAAPASTTGPGAPLPTDAAGTGTAAVPAVASPSPWSWPHSAPEWAWESWGLRTRAAYVPLRGSAAFWFVSRRMSEADADATAKSVAAAKERDDAVAALPPLDAAQWHKPLGELLAATPASHVVFTPIRRVTLSSARWVRPRERVVLLGDAAHAVPPNLAAGGMMSMQDAVALASALRTVYGEDGKTFQPQLLPGALQQYVRSRRWPVRLVQWSSAMVARVGQLSSPRLLALRDGLIQLVPSRLRSTIFRIMHRAFLGWRYAVPDLGVDGLYARFFTKDDWERMPPLLQHFHSRMQAGPNGPRGSAQQTQTTASATVRSHRCSGIADCSVGSSSLARLARVLSAMPPPLRQAHVSVDIVQTASGGEEWHRTFRCRTSGSVHRFQTSQFVEEGRMVERIELFSRLWPGLLAMELLFDVRPLPAPQVGFTHESYRTRVRLARSTTPNGGGFGGLCIPLPRFASPRLFATTELSSPAATRWHFAVRVSAPNHAVARALMGNDLALAAYEGAIDRFDKREVREWLATLPPPALEEGSLRSSADHTGTSPLAFEPATPNPARTDVYPTVDANGERFRVLILGGYGLFGSRVAAGLLLRDPTLGLAHPHVLLNARHANPKAHASIVELVRCKRAVFVPADPGDPAACLQEELFDASAPGVLAERLRALRPHVLINCVGPFQGASYATARTCAEAGVHYIDLADGRDFVCNFASSPDLDALARKTRVTLISGASSVPGLSSAVLTDMLSMAASSSASSSVSASAAESSQPVPPLSARRIEIAISPGNHTPRGLATMQSILGQAGHAVQWRQQGRWMPVRVWGAEGTRRTEEGFFSERMRNRRRWLSVIDVPDLQLLPEHFAVRSSRDGRKEFVPTVEFRAGLESGVMHLGLLALSYPVRWGLMRSLAPYAALLKRVAEWGPFARSGSDTGGMVVLLDAVRTTENEVKSDGGDSVRVHWRLYAGSGEGVQIPATPAVVLCTKLQRAHEGRAPPPGSSATLQPGAYPCLSLFHTREFALHVSLFAIAGEVEMTRVGDSGPTTAE
jgi:2-polyprenyl-6-methoxyphenol hydroxylase-like FAD-dependent oxidoreductase